MYRSPLFSDDGGYAAENTTSTSASLSNAAQQPSHGVQRPERRRSPSSSSSPPQPSSSFSSSAGAHVHASLLLSGGGGGGGHQGIRRPASLSSSSALGTPGASPALPAASHTIAPHTTNTKTNTNATSTDFVPTPMLLHSNVPTTTTTTSTTTGSLSSYDTHLLFGTRHDLSEIFRTTVPITERRALPLPTQPSQAQSAAALRTSPQGRRHSPVTTPQRNTAHTSHAVHEERTPTCTVSPRAHPAQQEMSWNEEVEEEEEEGGGGAHGEGANSSLTNDHTQHHHNDNSSTSYNSTGGGNVSDGQWASPSEVLQMRAMCQDLVRRYELRLAQLQRELQAVTAERNTYAAEAGQLATLRKAYETAKKKYTAYVKHEQRWQEERALLQVQLQTLAVENQRLLLELDKQRRSAGIAEDIAAAPLLPSSQATNNNNNNNNKAGQMMSSAAAAGGNAVAHNLLTQRDITAHYLGSRGISLPTTLTDTSSVPQPSSQRLGSSPSTAESASSAASLPTHATAQERPRHTHPTTTATVTQRMTDRSNDHHHHSNNNALQGTMRGVSASQNEWADGVHTSGGGAAAAAAGQDHTLPPRTSPSSGHELPLSSHNHTLAARSEVRGEEEEEEGYTHAPMRTGALPVSPASAALTTATTNTSTTFTSLPSSLPVASPAALDMTAIAPANDTESTHEEQQPQEHEHTTTEQRYNSMVPAQTTTSSTSSSSSSPITSIATPHHSHIQVARRRSTTAAPQSPIQQLQPQPQPQRELQQPAAATNATTTGTSTTTGGVSEAMREATTTTTTTTATATTASHVIPARSEHNSHATATTATTTTTATTFSAPSSLASSIPLLYHMPRGPTEALQEEVKLLEALHRATQTNAELEARLRTEHTAWQRSEQQQRQAMLRLSAQRDRLVQRVEAYKAELHVAQAATQAATEQVHAMQGTLQEKQTALDEAHDALRALRVQGAQDLQAAQAASTAEAARCAAAQHAEWTRSLQESEAARAAALRALQHCMSDAAARMQAQEEVLDVLRTQVAGFVREQSGALAACEATMAAQQRTITQLQNQKENMQDEMEAQAQQRRADEEELATRQATIEELTKVQQGLRHELQMWQHRCAQTGQQAGRVAEMEGLVGQWQAQAQSARSECVVQGKYITQETQVWQTAMQVMQERHRGELAALAQRYAKLRERWRRARIAAGGGGDGSATLKKTEKHAAKEEDENKKKRTMQAASDNIEEGPAAGALDCDAVALLRASDVAVQQIAQSIMGAT